MSDLEGPGGEARRQAETWGSASDSAHVYQSRGSQYISHSHVYLHDGVGAAEGATARPGAHGSALERTRERVDLLIRTLSLTHAESQARCAELAGEARRARAEGRAEALAEVQEQLRAAELRVMKAQRMMREAELAREKTEALLTEAQRELALRRRAEERREEERARGNATPGTDPESARRDEEGEQFTELLDRVEAELGAVRDDLRSLGEGMPGHGGARPAARVIEGHLVRQPEEDDVSSHTIPLRGTDAAAKAPRDLFASRAFSAPPAVPLARNAATYVPGPPRRFLIGVAWVVSVIPPCVLMFIVTAIRAEYATEPAVWGAIAFTVVTVLGGVVLYALTLVVAGGVVLGMLDRGSEAGAALVGFAMCLGGSLGLLVASFWTPLTWPGPAGAWGRALASAVGWG
ncbi:hypothetical protein [Streptomyces sp. NPDC057199]|uniref:hypothetical protein n=1 Tax=Streptomyces sp. NPDC057199 TaxID=3346047 RepID=UPI00363827BF